MPGHEQKPSKRDEAGTMKTTNSGDWHRVVPNVIAWFLKRVEAGGRWMVPGDAFDRHQGLFWFLFASVLLMGLGAGLTWAYWDDLRQVSSSVNPEIPGSVESVSSTIRNVTLIVGGFLALVLTLWCGWLSERQVDLGRQSESNERQRRGTELLGHDVMAVRIGGIRALQDLAAEYPDEYRVRVLLQLCAFARTPTAPRSDYDVAREDDGRLRADVQAGVQAIGQGREREEVMQIEISSDYRPNLIGADLQRARLWSINLSRIVAVGTDFSESRFGDVDLTDADLKGARFTDCDLTGRNIDAPSSQMIPTCFAGADLAGADFTGADLAGVDFAYRRNRDKSRGDSCPARGLTQAQLEHAVSTDGRPPILNGVNDAETGAQLVWNG
ncbi:pentapeptide repeat-containing protein [Candidatus Poribacteria bacterium]|nr:pentapeptide repeat-containing protein [Candidatus Poribacteria bacterium]